MLTMWMKLLTHRTIADFWSINCVRLCGVKSTLPCGRRCSQSLSTVALGVLQHPPYSNDMSTCDFGLFLQLNEPLRGIRYHDVPFVLREEEHSIDEINTHHLANGIQRHLTASNDIQWLHDNWQKVQDFSSDYNKGM